MHNFCLMIKSYSKDLDHCRRLVDSINLFNVDNIFTYLVVEELDIEDFKSLETDLIAVVSMESIPVDFALTPINGISVGYINQEITKLAFWKLGLSKNYLCLDSDCKFIRPFYKSDFMFDYETPYTFLTEDRALQADNVYYEQYWVSRKESILRIVDAIGYAPEFIETCHNTQVFSGKVLDHFENSFMAKKNLSYTDVLEISPYEFSWYNFWLQKNFQQDLQKREPNFLMIHTEQMELNMRIQNINESDVARGYLGIVWNSNYSRGFGVVDGSDDRTSSLARLLTFREMWAILLKRVELGFKIKIFSLRRTH